MADPVTTNLGLAQPIRGTDVGTWDVPMNANAGIIDNCFGGFANITLSNSPVTLSSAQYRSAFIRLTGAITSNIAITFPSLGGFYTVINDTTNSSAYVITLQTSNAAGYVIGLPPGCPTDVMNDSINMRYRRLPNAGTYWDYAGSSYPAWVTACTVWPWLYCNGTTFSSAIYPSLATLLGGTTLPDFRGRMNFFYNDGSSRIQSSLAGINGNTMFSVGGNNFISLSSQNLPNVNFPVTDPGHTHTQTNNANHGTLSPEQFGGSPIGAPGAATVTINNNVTGITVNSGGTGNPIPMIPPAATVGIRLIRAT